MNSLNKLFSEEDEQIISDYTQYAKPQQRQDNDGGGRFDDRRRQRFNDRPDRTDRGGFQKPRRDDDRERQQREYELRKAAETKAELKALKEAMKANEDPYKDAMRREEYYRARRKRDMTKLGLLGLAGILGYTAGNYMGRSDKEKEMKKAQEEQQKKDSPGLASKIAHALFSNTPGPGIAGQVQQQQSDVQSLQQKLSQTPQPMQQLLQQQLGQEQDKLTDLQKKQAQALINQQLSNAHGIQASTAEQASQQPNVAQNAMAYAGSMAKQGYDAVVSRMGRAYDNLRGLFSNPEMAELVTRHFNAPPQSAGPYPQSNNYAPTQVSSPQQPLQSASIGAPARPQAVQTASTPTQGQRPQMSEEEAKQIQKLDTDIAVLQQDNMAKQQQLQQLQQQNIGGALKNISSDSSAAANLTPLTNAVGNVVRGAGSGVVNALGDAAGAAWNGIKGMFSASSADIIEKYFAEQQPQQNPKAVIRQKTEVRDKLKKQNEELTEAVDEKENSLGTMLYQLSATSPVLAGQIVGSAGNALNTAVMGGINLINQGYSSLTGGKTLVNTDRIVADPNATSGGSMTEYLANRKAAEQAQQAQAAAQQQKA
jgi:hypothetical protein